MSFTYLMNPTNNFVISINFNQIIKNEKLLYNLELSD